MEPTAGRPAPATSAPSREPSSRRAPHPDAGRFFDVHEEPRYGVHLATLRPDAPAVFTPELIADLRAGQSRVRRRVRQGAESGAPDRIRYQVFASDVPTPITFANH